ncbi:hypothetical protein J3492_02615 [Psychrobacter sp. F1192]|uniref:Uncharacterized protein n=1 Tax=Psychrobacter coccoides TaxID=2818440 RepID=A0ABS3NL21_9GAMM|nr:hypothetical protein [Psychrobacter coccoides]MBO1530104.1 hypothetical protein [Psychrobacter coccoides]
MLRLNYTLKCWSLGIIFFTLFYFGILANDPSLNKYLYSLAISTVLFPIAKQAVDVVGEYINPDIDMFNGLLSALLINILIWIFTPFIAAFALLSFLFYSIYTFKDSLSN